MATSAQPSLPVTLITSQFWKKITAVSILFGGGHAVGRGSNADLDQPDYFTSLNNAQQTKRTL
jgi:hypothetical protein